MIIHNLPRSPHPNLPLKQVIAPTCMQSVYASVAACSTLAARQPCGALLMGTFLHVCMCFKKLNSQRQKGNLLKEFREICPLSMHLFQICPKGTAPTSFSYMKKDASMAMHIKKRPWQTKADVKHYCECCFLALTSTKFLGKTSYKVFCCILPPKCPSTFQGETLLDTLPLI